MTDQERERAFERFMDQGHDFSWSGQWVRAAEAYRRALELKPETVAAYTSMGLALMNAGRREEALRAYLRAEELRPGDPAALAKIAEIYETLNQPKSAAATYLMLADRFMVQRQPGLAVRAWQQTVRHDPHNKTALRRLAEAYRRGKRPDFAAQALVALARAHQEEGQTNQAIACCEQALALRPGLAAARTMLSQLRGTTPMSMPRETAPPREVPRPHADEWTDEEEEEESGTVAQAATPTEQATQMALVRMAEAFFEAAEGADLSLEALKARALDFQTRGLIEEAAKTYREVCDQGGETPEVLYNLGILYQEMLRFDDAIATLERVVVQPDYAMAAHFAIGQCYQRKGRIDEALDHFLEAIKIVDMQNVDRDRADDLIKLYEGLADSYEAKGDRAQAEHFTGALAEFLSSRGWEDKLRELRHRVGTLTGTNEPITLAEMLEAPDNDAVLQAMQSTQAYLEAGLYGTAIAECYWAVGLAPHYLPLHLRLADLFARQGRVGAAVDKYVMVADVYLMRGNHTKAVHCYQSAVDLAPLDQNVRSKLVDLLISHGNIDMALEHYLALAEGFYQLAQGDRAIERLNEALRLAPRGAPERQWSLEIQRRLADIHLQRLDWRRAAAALEAVVSQAPDDAEASQRLIDLYYKLGHEERALRALEEASQRMTERGNSANALTLWRNQAELRPDDLELQRRLGEQCAAAGDVAGACTAWEPLVERYVRGGQAPHAMALLRKMISLHPPREASYRRQLNALMTASTSGR